jgi:hypothetical protein
MKIPNLELSIAELNLLLPELRWHQLIIASIRYLYKFCLAYKITC